MEEFHISNSDLEIDEDTLIKKIDEIQKLVQCQNILPELSDKTLKLFLHSCMYDVNNTINTLNAYFKLRIESPYYFSDRNPASSKFNTIIEKGYCFLLPGTTPEKYNVIMAGYLPGDGTNYIFKDSIKRFMMQIDMWLSKLDICPGYIIMIECRYSTFSHYTSVSFNVLKKLCIYFQEALPMRLKGIYFINISTATNMLLTIAQPLLAKKINNMIYKYTEGDNEFMNAIPKSILPIDIGGESGKTIRELHDAAQQELIDNSAWFKEQDKIIKSLSENYSPPENKSMFRMLF